MRKIIPVLCTIIIVCLIFSVCGSKDIISEGAQAVLNTTMNTPNTELFNPDLIISPEMNEDEKEQVLIQQKEYNTRWETLLGQYFSPGSFDLFASSYIRTRFFADDPLPSKLISTELAFRDDTREEVNTQVDINGEIHTFKVTFLYNPDGLFYRVEIEEIHE